MHDTITEELQARSKVIRKSTENRHSAQEKKSSPDSCAGSVINDDETETN